uniref:Uncharacterized protein n=1 Tax=Glossina palpalis gambiensis TaxID=67801 RepID=A0A1B0C4R2_9MUSC
MDSTDGPLANDSRPSSESKLIMGFICTLPKALALLVLPRSIPKSVVANTPSILPHLMFKSGISVSITIRVLHSSRDDVQHLKLNSGNENESFIKSVHCINDHDSCTAYVEYIGLE